MLQNLPADAVITETITKPVTSIHMFGSEPVNNKEEKENWHVLEMQTMSEKEQKDTAEQRDTQNQGAKMITDNTEKHQIEKKEPSIKVTEKDFNSPEAATYQLPKQSLVEVSTHKSLPSIPPAKLTAEGETRIRENYSHPLSSKKRIIIQKRIVKVIIIVNGKPVETEEVIEEPEEVTDEVLQNLPSGSVVTESATQPEVITVYRVIRRKVIRKIVIIDGKPVETEEVIEEPEEVTEEVLQNLPPGSVVTKTVTKPCRSTIYDVINEMPLKREGVLEGPKMTGEVLQNLPLSSAIAEPEMTSTQKIIKNRVTKKTTVVDGKPVETEVIEEPEDEVDSALRMIASEVAREAIGTEHDTFPVEEIDHASSQEATHISTDGGHGIEGRPGHTGVEEMLKEPCHGEAASLAPTFALPLPDHANDWMELIEGGGFTLDDEDEEPPVSHESQPSSQSPAVFQVPTVEPLPSQDNVVAPQKQGEESNGVIPAADEGNLQEHLKASAPITQPAFGLVLPDHANDWLEVIESGGFTLDSEDEAETEPSTFVETNTLLTDQAVKSSVSQVPTKDVSKPTEETVEEVSLFSKEITTAAEHPTPAVGALTFTGNEVSVEETSGVASKPEEAPAQQDSAVPKKPAFNLPVPDHANDWMEMVLEGGFSLDEEEDETEAAPQTSEKDVQSLPKLLEKKAEKIEPEPLGTTEYLPEKEKQGRSELTIVESLQEHITVSVSSENLQEKPVVEADDVVATTKTAEEIVTATETPATPPVFGLPIPDHANDFLEIIEGGGFTLDSESEEESSNILESTQVVVSENKILQEESAKAPQTQSQEQNTEGTKPFSYATVLSAAKTPTAEEPTAEPKKLYQYQETPASVLVSPLPSVPLAQEPKKDADGFEEVHSKNKRRRKKGGKEDEHKTVAASSSVPAVPVITEGKVPPDQTVKILDAANNSSPLNTDQEEAIKPHDDASLKKKLEKEEVPKSVSQPEPKKKLEKEEVLNSVSQSEPKKKLEKEEALNSVSQPESKKKIEKEEALKSVSQPESKKKLEKEVLKSVNQPQPEKKLEKGEVPKSVSQSQPEIEVQSHPSKKVEKKRKKKTAVKEEKDDPKKTVQAAPKQKSEAFDEVKETQVFELTSIKTELADVTMETSVEEPVNDKGLNIEARTQIADSDVATVQLEVDVTNEKQENPPPERREVIRDTETSMAQGGSEGFMTSLLSATPVSQHPAGLLVDPNEIILVPQWMRQRPIMRTSSTDDTITTPLEERKRLFKTKSAPLERTSAATDKDTSTTMEEESASCSLVSGEEYYKNKKKRPKKGKAKKGDDKDQERGSKYFEDAGLEKDGEEKDEPVCQGSEEKVSVQPEPDVILLTESRGKQETADETVKEQNIESKEEKDPQEKSTDILLSGKVLEGVKETANVQSVTVKTELQKSSTEVKSLEEVKSSEEVKPSEEVKSSEEVLPELLQEIAAAVSDINDPSLSPKEFEFIPSPREKTAMEGKDSHEGGTVNETDLMQKQGKELPVKDFELVPECIVEEKVPSKEKAFGLEKIAPNFEEALQEAMKPVVDETTEVAVVQSPGGSVSDNTDDWLHVSRETEHPSAAAGMDVDLIKEEVHFEDQEGLTVEEVSSIVTEDKSVESLEITPDEGEAPPLPGDRPVDSMTVPQLGLHSEQDSGVSVTGVSEPSEIINTHQQSSYANILIHAPAIVVEKEPEETKKPYVYRNPTLVEVEEPSKEDKQIAKVDEEGFTEFVSKKERFRRKTHSTSAATEEIEEAVQSVVEEIKRKDPAKLTREDVLEALCANADEADSDDEVSHVEMVQPKRNKSRQRTRSKRSSKQSESEKEIGEIAAAIERGETPPKPKDVVEYEHKLFAAFYLGSELWYDVFGIKDAELYYPKFILEMQQEESQIADDQQPEVKDVTAQMKLQAVPHISVAEPLVCPDHDALGLSTPIPLESAARKVATELPTKENVEHVETSTPMTVLPVTLLKETPPTTKLVSPTVLPVNDSSSYDMNLITEAETRYYEYIAQLQSMAPCAEEIKIPADQKSLTQVPVTATAAVADDWAPSPDRTVICDDSQVLKEETVINTSHILSKTVIDIHKIVEDSIVIEKSGRKEAAPQFVSPATDETLHEISDDVPIMQISEERHQEYADEEAKYTYLSVEEVPKPRPEVTEVGDEAATPDENKGTQAILTSEKEEDLTLTGSKTEHLNTSEILVPPTPQSQRHECMSVPSYDMSTIQTAEAEYQKYLASETQTASWADVVAHSKPITEASEELPKDPEDEKSFILYQTKTIKVLFPEEEPTKPKVPCSVDEEGFTEFVSKQELRRRLRSSCSEEPDVKDIVPYVPRIELPEVEIIEDQHVETEKEPISQSEPEALEESMVETVEIKVRHRRRTDSHRKSQRSRVSAAEKEVDEILRQMSREDILQKYANYDAVRYDKWQIEDSERIYHEMLAEEASPRAPAQASQFDMPPQGDAVSILTQEECIVHLLPASSDTPPSPSLTPSLPTNYALELTYFPSYDMAAINEAECRYHQHQTYSSLVQNGVSVMEEVLGQRAETEIPDKLATGDTAYEHLDSPVDTFSPPKPMAPIQTETPTLLSQESITNKQFHDAKPDKEKTEIPLHSKILDTLPETQVIKKETADREAPSQMKVPDIVSESDTLNQALVTMPEVLAVKQNTVNLKEPPSPAKTPVAEVKPEPPIPAKALTAVPKPEAPIPAKAPAAEVKPELPSPAEAPAFDVKAEAPSPVEVPAAEIKAEAPSPVKAPAAEVKAEAPSPVKAPAAEVKAEAPTPVKTPAAEVKAEAPSPVKTPAAEVKAEAPSPVKTPAAEVKAEAPSPVKTPAAEIKAEAPSPMKAPDAEIKAEAPSPVKAPAAEVKAEPLSPVKAPAAEIKAEALSPVKAPAAEIKAEAPSPVKVPNAEIKAEAPSPVKAPDAEIKAEAPSPVKAPDAEIKAEAPSPVRAPDAKVKRSKKPHNDSKEGTAQPPLETLTVGHPPLEEGDLLTVEIAGSPLLYDMPALAEAESNYYASLASNQQENTETVEVLSNGDEPSVSGVSVCLHGSAHTTVSTHEEPPTDMKPTMSEINQRSPIRTRENVPTEIHLYDYNSIQRAEAEHQEYLAQHSPIDTSREESVVIAEEQLVKDTNEKETDDSESMIHEEPSFGNYDMNAIELAETKYQEYLAQQGGTTSWAHVVSQAKTVEIEEEKEEPIDEKSFILYHTKKVQVVVAAEEPRKPSTPMVDDEGFTEFVSKQERRRRLRSSCSEEPEDHVTDIVPYVPRIELPEVEVSEDPELTDSEPKLVNEDSLQDQDDAEKQFTPKQKDSEDKHVPKETSEDSKGISTPVKHGRSHKFSREKHHKRHRSRVSEAEQEVDDILRQMDREEVLQKNAGSDSFLCNQWIFNDAEKNYYEMIEQQKKDDTNLVSEIREKGKDNDDDDDSHDGGYDSPPGLPPADNFDGRYARTLQTEIIQANPPHGVANWTDESTYLSLTPPPPDPVTVSSTPGSSMTQTPTHIHDMTQTQTPPPSMSKMTLTEMSKKAAPPQAPYQASSTLAQQKKHQIEIKEKVSSAQEKLQSFQERLQSLVDHSVIQQLTIIQTLIIEMKRLEDELNYLEEKGKRLEQDSEVLSLQAKVSGLTTRLKTVLAQAHTKRTEIEGRQSTAEQQKLHLIEYQQLLQDLECWVTETYNQITADISLSSSAEIREQIANNQTLQRDLCRREQQLMELQEKCERVEGDSHIISLAKEMTDHLTFLSQTISDTRFVLQNRLHQLKEILANEEMKRHIISQDKDSESTIGGTTSVQQHSNAVLYQEGHITKSMKNVEKPKDDSIRSNSIDTGDAGNETETLIHGNITTIQQIMQRGIIKNITIIDGKPVETEEIVEEPDVTQSVLVGEGKDILRGDMMAKEEGTKVHKIIRQRIIKKTRTDDGKIIETEEEIEPEVINEQILQTLPADSVITKTITDPEVTTVHKIIRKKVIKKIVIIDGKPVETEEVIEEPEEVTEEMLQNLPADSVITETVTDPEVTTVHKIIRRKVVKKIVIINGKPVETEEVIEEPEEVTEEMLENVPADSIITETVTEPEVTTVHKIIRRRVIKKIIIVDGKPVETEEVIEDPEEVTEEMLQNLPADSVITETVTEPEVTTVRKIIRRVIKKIIIVDGKPVETEEVIEEPEDVTEEIDLHLTEEKPIKTVEVTQKPGRVYETLQNLPCDTVIQTVTEPKVTTVHKIIRRRVIKKIVIIDGKPVEKEEVIEEPEEVTEEMLQNLPDDSVITETVTEPEVTTVHKIIRRRVIKKIVIIDGKPVETEEVIEEPEEVSEEMLQNLPADSVITETVTEPEVTTVHKIIRRRVIKKIVIIDGKPVETEEIIEEPEEVTEEMLQNLPADSVITETVTEPEVTTVHKIIRRVIKKIIMVDGKPVETEEVIEEPEEVTEEMLQNLPADSVITETVTEPEVTTVHKIIRRRVIKKTVIIDGKPVETEEVIEEPEEVTEEILQNLPADSVITEVISKPEDIELHMAKEKPVKTEEPEKVTEEMLQNLPADSVITEAVTEPEVTTVHKIIRRRMIKKIVIIDGKPVETEEVIEEPEEVTEEMLQNLPDDSVITEVISEPKEVDLHLAEVKTADVKEEPEKVTEEMLQNLSADSVITETVTEPEVTTVHKIIRRRVIKKTIMIDGKPVESEEVIEEPEEVTEEMLENLPADSVITETLTEPEVTTVYKIIRRRVIRKIVNIDGKPVETEEVIEEPEEVTEEILQNLPADSVITETATEPEVTTVHKVIRRVIKKITMVDGKPVETEEVIEEPEEVMEKVFLESPEICGNILFAKTDETEKGDSKIPAIIDAKPAETEEVVKIPVHENSQSNLLLETSMGDIPSSSETSDTKELIIDHFPQPAKDSLTGLKDADKVEFWQEDLYPQEVCVEEQSSQLPEDHTTAPYVPEQVVEPPLPEELAPFPKPEEQFCLPVSAPDQPKEVSAVHVAFKETVYQPPAKPTPLDKVVIEPLPSPPLPVYEEKEPSEPLPPKEEEDKDKEVLATQPTESQDEIAKPQSPATPQPADSQPLVSVPKDAESPVLPHEDKQADVTQETHSIVPEDEKQDTELHPTTTVTEYQEEHVEPIVDTKTPQYEKDIPSSESKEEETVYTSTTIAVVMAPEYKEPATSSKGVETVDDSVAVITDHEMKTDKRVEPVSDIPVYEISEVNVVDRCEVVEERLVTQHDETDMTVPDEDSVKKSVEKDEKEIQRPGKEDVIIEPSVPMEPLVLKDLTDAKPTESKVTAEVSHEDEEHVLPEATELVEKESEFDIKSEPRETPGPAEVMEEELHEKTDIATSSEVTKEVDQEPSTTDAGIQSPVESLDKEEKEPDNVGTDQKDAPVIPLSESNIVPDEELTQHSDDLQVTTDKLIDEHTAGPPEIGPQSSQPPSSVVEKPEEDEEAGKELQPLVPGEEETSGEKLLVEEQIISQEWQTIYTLLKRRQNLREAPQSSLPTTITTLMLAPSSPPSPDQQQQQIDENLEKLKSALDKKELIVVQKVIISIVETVSTWLETIEYRIYTVKNTEDISERNQQYEYLQTELHIIEEKLVILEKVTQSALEIFSEETIITIIETVKCLRQQVNQVEKVRKEQQENSKEEEERYTQYMDAVANAGEEVSKLKAQLYKLQNSKMTPEEKLRQLELLLITNEDTRDSITQLLLSSHDMRLSPSRHMGDKLASIQEELCDVHDSVEKELDQVLRLTTTTTEYEETLMELTHLIEMAETILEARVVARDHSSLVDTITKHKKLFLSLRQCQKVLESLDTALEPNSRVHYQELYSRSYLKASKILDKATQRNHQLTLLEAEWLRLLNQLKEEEAWMMSASEQVTQLHTLSSDTYQENTNSCKDCQDLLVESVTHEAHMGHLVEMVRKVGDSVTCTHLETRVSSHHQRNTSLRQEVSRLLERLEEMHVHWAAYQTQMDQLQEWCSLAKASLENIDLTPQDQQKLKEQFNQIWNLRAQFDSQSVLLSECMDHFDKSVGLVNMTDETNQRHFLSQFRTEWNELEELLHGKEKELHRIQIQVVPVPQLLSETQDALTFVEDALQNIDTNITSVQQLRDIQENYKVLRIKIMNSKGNLDYLTEVSSEDEDQDQDLMDNLGKLSLTCQELIHTIQQRIASLEYTLDNVQKTVSRVERISLTMKHLKSTLERCQAIDKEGEQILKAAFHSCQTIHGSVSRTEGDITKVKQSMENLSQDPHHPCHLTELSAQIDTLEEELKSLSECIKETRENLKSRLEIWQKFMSTSDAVDGFLQEVEYLLESAVDLPSSVNMDALRKHVEDLQSLQESMTTNETLLEMLKSRAVQVEKNHSVETQLVRWNNVSQKLESVILRYETALELWNHFITVQEEVRVWVESKITMVVSLQSRGITHEHRAQIQVLVGEAAWSGERVSELRQLAHQIRLHLAEDSAQDTPLVAEVERLGFRITNLTEAITQLSSNLTQQVNAEQHQKKENALQELEAGINGAHTLLALPEPEVNEAAERATQLKDQLVALGGTGGPVIDSGPSQVVEAWQVAVRDTHSRYQQVVAGLGGDEEQLAAALTTWKQYVESVEASMSAPAPASREGLHEASRLCQVHRSILNTQTNVLLTLQEQAQQENAPPRIRDLQGRLRELILRHKTVLTTVTEREQLLLQTITTWETYRVKIAQLQTWILALEQEKQGLQLRQVARRRLDKVISRLQSLQEQLGRGEEQVEEIEKLCQILVASCDSSIHPILKAELASLQQRVTNMRAGVETWLGYLNKSSSLWQRYEDVYTKLHTILAEIQAGLSADMPSDFCSVQETIKKYNETTAALEALSGDLSLLRTTREEMVDSLTPADLRLVTQRMWRVTQLQAELLHQYRLKISTLEDRLELWELYDTRYQQFLTWAKDMEGKIDGGSEQYIDTLIRKLEHDYQEDINAKSVEMHWLLSEGEELISCSKEDQAAELKEKVKIIETTWKHIHDKCNSRKQKLQDIVTTINKAEVTLAELKEWLFLIEKKLSSPVIFQNSSKKEIDRLLEAEEEIRKEIEKQSGTISSVLNLCDMVIHDCNEFDANGDTDSLQEAHHNLDRRWGEICTRSAERKAFIKKTWKMWQELVTVNNSFSSWLTNMESRLRDLDVASYHVPYSSLEEMVATVHQLQPLIHNQTPQYESLNQHYRVLARPYGRENRLDQENEIRTMVKTSNARFHTLSYQITVILRRISFSRRLFEKYEASRERLMIWLNDFDLKITEYEQYPHGNLEHKKRALLGLVAEYERHENEQKEFEDLITYLYQRSCYSDCTIIEESLTEYWVCRKLIRTRLLALQKDVEDEITQTTTVMTSLSEERLLQDQEDDYRVPLVSDAELQNLEPTLSPADMSFIGAVGGRSMVVEMRVALDECKKIILQLEEALKCPTPQGAEVDKMYYSFSKQLAGCRSSVDLLSSLKQHTGDDAEARELHPEIDAVIEEFTLLEAKAQAKQQRLKENSETSSLTCPLCCRRNWQQFENDMWRLEQWLAHAEATQSTQHNPPLPMEQLEEVAQDHREFLMDLDGHKSVIMSLNIIGKHLADHTRDERRATRVRDRLAATNRRWEAVCAAASVWQAKLQTTLMGNSEFHSTIADLLAWTETTEESLLKIAAEEDMEEPALRDRVARVLDVRAEVERCEPRVASLHEAAQHLLPTQQDDKSAAVREQLAILSQRLQLLLQMCSKQLVLLSQILGQDFTSSLASLASSGLYESAEFSLSRPTSPSSLSASFHSDAHDVLGAEGSNEGVVRRSYRFLGRVMRAALPIQALMLLMLGVASLVPTSEDDYACSMANNFARSLDPMLRYPNGPPPF
ncbi:hypothetical protein O3P69_015107 [Scylla paramamosain]|uniref:KASH domain-containing protein n=1 Tax=Scylla paramamosain TaxID=85552 RepID=A0AAW0T4W4_SCYPA